MFTNLPSFLLSLHFPQQTAIAAGLIFQGSSEELVWFYFHDKAAFNKGKIGINTGKIQIFTFFRINGDKVLEQ